MSRVNLYQVLGVEPDASVDEIRGTFRELARKYHPDRYRADRRDEAEQRFQQITEAFNILSKKDLREQYDQETARMGGGTRQDPGQVAKALAAKGAEAFRAGRLPEAREILRMAVSHDEENSRAHYFLGRTLKALDEPREALRHLERAVALEPMNVTIVTDAASAFLAQGMENRARRFAEEAVRLDPENRRAREIMEQLD